MALWQRIHRIIKTNLNAPPGHAGSPKADIDALVRDMEEAVLELRQNAAAAISSRNATQRRVQRAAEEAERQQGDAETAVREGDGAPARAELRDKAGAGRRPERLRTQLQEEQDLARRLEDELRQAEDKLSEIRSRCEALMAKKTRLATREELARSADRPAGRGGTEAACDALDRLEDSVREQQDEVEAREQVASGSRARTGTPSSP